MNLTNIMPMGTPDEISIIDPHWYESLKK
jgi:hypothetical protein